MKTFITVSVDRKDLVDESLKQVIQGKIMNVVDAAILLMESNQLVQVKITNLPPMKEET